MSTTKALVFTEYVELRPTDPVRVTGVACPGPVVVPPRPVDGAPAGSTTRRMCAEASHVGRCSSMTVPTTTAMSRRAVDHVMILRARGARSRLRARATVRLL